MRYMKPETENNIGCLSTIFWPLGLIMAIFGFIFREKHQSPYADPDLAKKRKGKHAVKHFTANNNIDPWELSPEEMPWEK